MCMRIDTSVTSLNKRIVWKVFDKPNGKIVSLFQASTYPKGKLIERDQGATSMKLSDGTTHGVHGLHFYLSKAVARSVASLWPCSYIAKFKVDPKDFMFAGENKVTAMYERATRIGNFIKVC